MGAREIIVAHKSTRKSGAPSAESAATWICRLDGKPKVTQSVDGSRLVALPVPSDFRLVGLLTGWLMMLQLLLMRRKSSLCSTFFV